MWLKRSSGVPRSRPRNMRVLSSIIRRYGAVVPGPRLRSSSLLPPRQYSLILVVGISQSTSSLYFEGVRDTRWMPDNDQMKRTFPGLATWADLRTFPHASLGDL